MTAEIEDSTHKAMFDDQREYVHVLTAIAQQRNALSQ